MNGSPSRCSHQIRAQYSARMPPHEFESASCSPHRHGAIQQRCLRTLEIAALNGRSLTCVALNSALLCNPGSEPHSPRSQKRPTGEAIVSGIPQRAGWQEDEVKVESTKSEEGERTYRIVSSANLARNQAALESSKAGFLSW